MWDDTVPPVRPWVRPPGRQCSVPGQVAATRKNANRIMKCRHEAAVAAAPSPQPETTLINFLGNSIR